MRFDDVELGIPGTHAVFAFPGLGLAGLLAFQATGDVFEPEERLSLNNSCGTRDVYRLPQAIVCRDCACLLVCYPTLASKKRAPRF